MREKSQSGLQEQRKLPNKLKFEIKLLFIECLLLILRNYQLYQNKESPILFCSSLLRQPIHNTSFLGTQSPFNGRASFIIVHNGLLQVLLLFI